MKVLKGVVVSDKMEKTAIVKVDRQIMHPLYKKQYTMSKRYKVENPENKYKTGDVVEINSSRPLSRHKSFVIVKKIGESASREELGETELAEAAKINEPVEKTTEETPEQLGENNEEKEETK